MDKDAIPFIIGSPNKNIQEAIKHQCIDCKTDVWISPWNDKLIAICLECAKKREGNKPFKITIKEKDKQRAMEEIQRRRSSKKWNMYN